MDQLAARITEITIERARQSWPRINRRQARSSSGVPLLSLSLSFAGLSGAIRCAGVARRRRKKGGEFREQPSDKLANGSHQLFCALLLKRCARCFEARSSPKLSASRARAEHRLVAARFGAARRDWFLFLANPAREKQKRERAKCRRHLRAARVWR